MSAGGPLDWVGDHDRIREARSRTGFTGAKRTNPAIFVAADHPLQTLAPPQQRRAINELTEIATAEGSALRDQDWKSLIDPSISLEANKQILLERGAKLPEEEREERRQRAAERADDAAIASVRDSLMGICDDVIAAGGDGAQALETAADGAVPDQPGIDGEEVLDAVQDIVDEFTMTVVRNAIEACRIEQETEVTGAPTATDAQGRPIRPNREIVDIFTSTVQDEGIDAALADVTSVELAEVAEALRLGDLSAEQRDRLERAAESVPEDELGKAADANEGLFQVLFELNVRIPPPPAPDVADLVDDEPPVIEERGEEAAAAADRVEDLVEPTPTRGVEHYERLVLALESEDPVPGLPLSEERLDALTERDRSRLLESARDLRDDIAAREMTVEDFPEIQSALTPGPGKTRGNFWQPVLDELRANEEFPTLADRGVSNDELNTLNHADQARESFIAQVEQEISRIEGDTGGGGPQLQPGGSPGSLDIGDIAEAGAERIAERNVPDRERTDPRTGEDWTASPQQVGLEKRFMVWAQQTKPQNRWDAVDFEYRPENRDMSMRRWANLQIQAGNSTEQEAIDAGLPAEWFNGEGGEMGTV